MAKVLLLLLGIIISQQYSKAAPSEASENKHPVITPNVQEDVTLDREPRNEKYQANDNDASQSQRQKRYYDFTGFDYSPYDYPPAFLYSSKLPNLKRDDSQNTAVYGGEDALSTIFRRLHEVVRDVRYQNVPRPVHTPVPAYIPIFYIPHLQNCGCNSNVQKPTPPVNSPTSQTPLQPTNTDQSTNGIETTTNSSVTIDNRVGGDDFEDKIQNWGIATNKPGFNDEVSEDNGERPISFDPIPPEEPLDIPVPPVEHGTIQAGLGPVQNPNLISSSPPGQKFPNPPAQNFPTPSTQNFPAPPAQNFPIPPSYPQEAALDPPTSSSKNFMPSLCDGAILSCCNRPQVTEKCFEAQGCENPYVYGNPCNPEVQRKVLDRFQTYFQNRRAG